MLQESSDDKILYTESDQKKSILESDLSLENVQLDITHPQSSINKSEIHDGVITIKDETAFVTNAQSFEEHYDPEYIHSIAYEPKSFALRIRSAEHEAKKGENGKVGEKGKPGVDGIQTIQAHTPPIIGSSKGDKGANGTNGSPGGKGGNGKPGEKGQDALAIYLKLSGTPQELKLSGSYNGTVKLDHNQVIWIDGRGGTGGEGGDGGTGGEGGKGGNGAPGGPGADAETPGQDGYPGGNGGDGGDGGKSGDGGNGGRGGDGGNGAKVLIETSDPKLLMLLAIDVRGGLPGKGGAAGKPGKPGAGGKGGPGGEGGKGMPEGNTGRNGEPGKSGNDGLLGPLGAPGKEGEPGKKGKDGCIFIIDTKSNEIGYKRYNVKILNFEVAGVTDDGIFEPGEEVLVKNILVQNDGHFTLPSGTRMTLQQTETFESLESDGHLLPELKPGEKATCKFSLKGKIIDIPQPLHTGKYVGSAEIGLFCELIGREFTESKKTTRITTQYPLRLERMVSPSVMKPGEISKFRIEITNISNMDYGIKSETGNSVKYKIYLCDELRVPGKENENCIEGSVDAVATQNTTSVKINIMLSKNAEIFKRVKWKTELLLRDKVIEFQEREVRVCPEFNQNVESTDLLFITNPKLSLDEYKCYQKIFTGLGLTPNFFDSEMYDGVSIDKKTGHQHDVSWVGKFSGKPIVFPLSDSDSIKLISGQDIVTHFVNNQGDPEDKLDSGLVIIGGDPSSTLLKQMYKCSRSEQPLSEKEFSDYFYVNSPTREFMNKRIKSILSKYHSEQPSHIFNVFVKEYAPKSIGYYLYTYGKAVIKQLPLSRIHRLLCVTEGDDVIADFLSKEAKDILEPSKTIFKTNSRFFEVFLAIVTALSIEKKLHLLKGNCDAYKQKWRFYIEDEKRDISLFDLVKCCLYTDLKNEFFYKDQGLRRVQKLIDIVKKNPSEFWFDQGIFAIWNVVCRLEANTYWRSLPFVSNFNEKRSKLSKLKEEFGAFLDEVAQQKEGVDILTIKQKAEAEAKSSERLKLRDLQKMTIMPLGPTY